MWDALQFANKADKARSSVPVPRKSNVHLAVEAADSPEKGTWLPRRDRRFML
jgi:hypothetical protein